MNIAFKLDIKIVKKIDLLIRSKIYKILDFNNKKSS